MSTNMKKILLLEDNLLQAKGIIDIIKNYDEEIEVSYAPDVKQAEELLNKDIPFDAFFVDISLNPSEKDSAGLTWANALLQTSRYSKTPICFITAFPEYIYRAVNETHCFSYILKPYSKMDIIAQLDTLFQEEKNIVIKTTDNIYVSFSADDLLFVQSKGRYLYFTVENAVYRSRQYSLKNLLPILPSEFVRCHKSYIINRNCVDNIDLINHYAQIKNARQPIPLSRNFKL